MARFAWKGSKEVKASSDVSPAEVLAYYVSLCSSIGLDVVDVGREAFVERLAFLVHIADVAMDKAGVKAWAIGSDGSDVGTFNVASFGAWALGEMEKVYIVLRACDYPQEVCLAMLRSARARSVERASNERKRFAEARPRQAKVRGKGASGRAVTRASAALAGLARLAELVKTGDIVNGQPVKALPRYRGDSPL